MMPNLTLPLIKIIKISSFLCEKGLSGEPKQHNTNADIALFGKICLLIKKNCTYRCTDELLIKGVAKILIHL